MLFSIIKTSLIFSITSCIVRIAFLNNYENCLVSILQNCVTKNTKLLPLCKLAYNLRNFCDRKSDIYPIFGVSGIIIFFSSIIRMFVLLQYMVLYQNMFLILFGLHGIFRALYSLDSILNGLMTDIIEDFA